MGAGGWVKSCWRERNKEGEVRETPVFYSIDGLFGLKLMIFIAN